METMKVLLILIFLATFSTLPSWASDILNDTKIIFPSQRIKINEGKTKSIQANVTAPSVNNGPPTYKSVQITTLNTVNGNLSNGSISNLEWTYNDVDQVYECSFEFEVTGKFVGYFEVIIELIDPTANGTSPKVVDYKVAIIRTDVFNTLSYAFTITMTVLVCINTFVMGLQLDWKIILAVLRRPVAPLIGFCCQFLIMPLLAFLWASIFLSGSHLLQFGYFAVGCAPGGGNSNFWTLLLDGNVDLSVTMTFCSNMAALAMMPFWLFTLGQMFFRGLGGQIKIPFSNIIISLVLLIVPCLLGILTKHYKPKMAEQSKKFIKISTLIVIVVAICFGTASNIYVYSLITAKTLICGVLLPWGGFSLSYLVAYILRQSHVNCRTIAIETGIQNAGIAIILLTFSLGMPESDLALVMPVSVLLFTPIPLIVAYVGKVIYNCFHKKDKSNEKESEAMGNTKLKEVAETKQKKSQEAAPML